MNDKPQDRIPISKILQNERSPKLADVYREIDQRAATLREKDKAFHLTEADTIWPKLSNTKITCRCPYHQADTDNLFYGCYRRIAEAKARKETP